MHSSTIYTGFVQANKLKALLFNDLQNDVSSGFCQVSGCAFQREGQFFVTVRIVVVEAAF